MLFLTQITLSQRAIHVLLYCMCYFTTDFDYHKYYCICLGYPNKKQLTYLLTFHSLKIIKIFTFLKVNLGARPAFSTGCEFPLGWSTILSSGAGPGAFLIWLRAFQWTKFRELFGACKEIKICCFVCGEPAMGFGKKSTRPLPEKIPTFSNPYPPKKTCSQASSLCLASS